jgi:GTP-binding protein
MKDTDRFMLNLFRHQAIPHQVVLSKVDRMILPRHGKSVTKRVLEERLGVLQKLVSTIRTEIQPPNDGPPALGEILACCAENSKFKSLSEEQRGYLGISSLRWAILAATGFATRRSNIKIDVQASPTLPQTQKFPVSRATEQSSDDYERS